MFDDIHVFTDWESLDNLDLTMMSVVQDGQKMLLGINRMEGIIYLLNVVEVD